MNSEDRLSETLTGRRIVIAVDRRADELAAALARHGAEVERAPALCMLPHVDDPELLERTRDLIADPPQLLVVTTGVGLRGWFEAASEAGLDGPLRAALAGARILARGPKARGALVQAGLRADWIADSETAAEIAEHLAGEDLSGCRAAVQHHGSGADGLDEVLVGLGADVVSLTIYRWGPPRDPDAVRRSTVRAGRGLIDAVVFTSAPGAACWLETAEQEGALPGIVEHAGTGRLVLAVVGPVTAGPFVERGLPVLAPERNRLGALVREVVSHFERVPAAGSA
ncbi:uroporphyrinogen-III synthase [Brachybacterium phenoliresistens]|uniref:uroporphyrinogen-III synthase n=1 Tax=Brachybacterium phenoliresistens TaxID=396014 RepID=UPI0031E40D5F